MTELKQIEKECHWSFKSQAFIPCTTLQKAHKVFFILRNILFCSSVPHTKTQLVCAQIIDS